MKANDFMYKNDAGKDVCGAAAFNHYVFTECGGIDGFVEKQHFQHLKRNRFLQIYEVVLTVLLKNGCFGI